MNYLQNHCFCQESNWGGFYSCRHLVSFNNYEENNKEDWSNLVNEKAENHINDHILSIGKEINSSLSDDEIKRIATSDVPNLKPEVINWLNNSVFDRKDDECTKGWCIGSTDYRAINKYGITIFFHRKRDAMAFIKKFSVHKKPITYVQYFSDIRKKLNLETGKYEKFD